MADRITRTYYSHDEWRALGPLYHDAPAGGFGAGRSGPNDDPYDGTSRGDAPTTPKWATISLGGATKEVGNPHHTSKADSFTNAASQYQHLMQTLDGGGRPALKMVRALAKAGNELHQRAERMHGDGNKGVVLAPDTGTAKVLRGAIDETLKLFPPDKGPMRQELPRKPEDARLGELMKGLEAHQPPALRPRVIEKEGKTPGKMRFARADDPKGASNRYMGVLGLVADDGMADAAVDYTRTSVHKNLIVAPEKNKDLWGKLIERGGHRTEKLYGADRKQFQAIDDLVARTDRMVIFHNGDPSSRGAKAIAEATRAGKAARIFGPDGKEMPLHATARDMQQAHMSKREYAQSANAHAFEMPAGEPRALFALSRVRDQKGRQFDDTDLRWIAGRNETLSELADTCATEVGRESLWEEQKAGGHKARGALGLLADKDAMSRGQQSYLKLSREMRDDGQDIIGAADYPAQLLTSGKVPPYLIAEGNLDVLRNARTIVGISGAPQSDETDRRVVGSAATKAVSALMNEDVTTAYVLGQTPVDIPAKSNQIMILPRGKAHLSDSQKDKVDDVLDAGGAVVSVQPARHVGYYWDKDAFDPEKGKKGRLVGNPSIGNDSTERQAAALLGRMSDTVVVTDLNARKTNTPTHRAVEAHIQADRISHESDRASRAPRLPTVLNFQGMEGVDAVSGNRALVNAKGTTALSKAGFGDQAIEALGGRVMDTDDAGRQRAYPVALDVGANPQRGMMNLVRHLKGESLDLPRQKQKETSRAPDQMGA